MTLRSVILRGVGLCAVSHYAESDSTQYHTAQSREIEMSKNPKLFHTARSPILHRVKQFDLIFENFNFQDFYGLLYVVKFRKYFENLKMANTAWSSTPCSVILCGVYKSNLLQIHKCLTLHLVGLRAVSHCVTALSFAECNFIFAGLSLP